MNAGQLLKTMTTRQKIGQLFACGFHSAAVDDQAMTLIRDWNVGNFIHFARNIETIDQISAMNAELQRLCEEHNGAPAWISVDEEGGVVTRMSACQTYRAGAMACAAAGGQDIEQLACDTGLELLECGINMNLAPVLDVNTHPLNPAIGVRAYGDVPETVADLAMRAARGLSRAGVLAVCKHFPGYGEAALDPHLLLPVLNKTRSELDNVELLPFRRAVALGAEAIMSAHIVAPALDPEGVPCTLSHSVMTGLLRREYGFNGLLLSDCMQMKAIADGIGTPEGCLRGVLAGLDIVFVCHDPDVQLATLKLFESAARSGRLPTDVLDDRALRVLRLKEKYIAGKPGVKIDDETRRAHVLRSSAVSRKSITLVRDEGGLLPLAGKKIAVIAPAAPAGVAHGLGPVMNRLCGSEYVEFEKQIASGAPFEELTAVCQNADVILLGTDNAILNSGQRDVLRRAQRCGKPVVHAALRLPYDAALSADAAVCCYEYSPPAIDCLCDALLNGGFYGVLPVSLARAEAEL